MTRRKKRIICWTITGLLFALSVLLVVLSGLTGQTWITDSGGIPVAADAVMTAIRNGDWNTLETLVLNVQNLSPQVDGENSVQMLVWDAYLDSLQWSCLDTFEVQGAKVTQQLTVTCLDISTVTGYMAEILPEISDNALNITSDQALCQAAEAALSRKLPLTQHEVTLSFVRRDEWWKLVPNNALLALLSGFSAA